MSGDVFAEHRRWIVAMLRYRFVTLRDEAEDVCHDALIKAYEHRSSFRGECSEKTWLWKIAFRSAIAFLKHRDFLDTDPFWQGEDESFKDVSDRCKAMNQMEREMFFAAVLRLQKPKARVIFKAFLAGESPEQVAARVGMEESTARNIFQYGIRKAREHFAETS